jgi:hypothetical protein
MEERDLGLNRDTYAKHSIPVSWAGGIMPVHYRRRLPHDG